ncbi:glycosyltransferase family 4 protein, partial [Candidatus Saccharibacteria bacterium]|nr:glycosyltransferase family 4 protein [Candidatus Saccharibacteria bacterium]
VNKIMSGPGQRAWELAIRLSEQYQVTLYTPNISDLTSEQFQIKSFDLLNPIELRADCESADYILCQTVRLYLREWAGKDTKIIADLFDPIFLEALEVYKYKSLKYQSEIHQALIEEIKQTIINSDYFICANQRQKDLWLGFIFLLGKTNPASYHDYPNLENLITIVPFGLPEKLDLRKTSNTPGLPSKDSGILRNSSKGNLNSKASLRKKFGFSDHDKLVVWTGGLWNWFDTEIIIEAFKIISQTRRDIKMVFYGYKLVNTDMGSEVTMSADKAYALAKKYRLLDSAVFYYPDWISPSEMLNHLEEADIGISTHYDNLETRFSNRTRALYFIKARLPFITTKGDIFAELVEQKQLGRVVDQGDTNQLANTIIELLDSDLNSIKGQFDLIDQELSWDQGVANLNQMLAIDNTKYQQFKLKPKKDTKLKYLIRETLRKLGLLGIVRSLRIKVKERQINE